MLWDLNEGKHLYTLDSGDNINALCFSPNRYWLCAATGPSIKIWVRAPQCRKCAIKPKRAMMKFIFAYCIFCDDKEAVSELKPSFVSEVVSSFPRPVTHVLECCVSRILRVRSSSMS